MLAQVQKWGNSLGLRIPSALSKELGIHAGTSVDITIEDQHLVIKPQKFILEQMVSQISDDNLHEEAFPEDTPIGNEVW